jgi:hypothetical protein
LTAHNPATYNAALVPATAALMIAPDVNPSDSPVLAAPGGKASDPYGASPGDPLFVWVVWAAMFVAALWFVHRWGRNVPNGDDLDFLPVLTGQEPATWSWIWAQHNEHRMPLARILMLAMYWASGGDFRTGMYYNACALALASAAMILASRRARGSTASTDAFFPIVLLHWGHVEDLLWFFEIQLVTSTLLTIAILALIARSSRPTRAAIVGIGLCLVGLIACGAAGLALMPAIVFWLVALVVGIPRLRKPALGAAAGALAAAGLYVLHYHDPLEKIDRAILDICRTAVEFVSLSFVAMLENSNWYGWGAFTFALLLVALTLVARTFFKLPEERWRAAGLACFFVAMACLALAIGYGRTRYGARMGLTFRYVTLAAPIPCAIYVSVLLYTHGRIGHWLRLLLLFTAMFALWSNTDRGLFRAKAPTPPPPQQRWSLRPTSCPAIAIREGEPPGEPAVNCCL